MSTSKKSRTHLQCIHKNCVRFGEFHPVTLRSNDCTKYEPCMKMPVCLVFTILSQMHLAQPAKTLHVLFKATFLIYKIILKTKVTIIFHI